jgi:hypothetical protein
MPRWCLSLAITAGIAAAVILTACSLQKDSAKTRVENVLSGLTKDDQSSGYQTAICQWFDGSYTMGESDLESALNHFQVWVKQKSLKTPIKSYTIEKVTIQSDAMVPTSLVEVTINGAPYKIKVVKEQPMEWQ